MDKSCWQEQKLSKNTQIVWKLRLSGQNSFGVNLECECCFKNFPTSSPPPFFLFAKYGWNEFNPESSFKNSKSADFQLKNWKRKRRRRGRGWGEKVLIWTNTFSNLNKKHFPIWTNPFSNLNKYILQFGQIHLAIWTNTYNNLGNWQRKRRSRGRS